MAQLDHGGFQDQTGVGRKPQIFFTVNEKIHQGLKLFRSGPFSQPRDFLLLAFAQIKHAILRYDKADQEISELAHEGPIKLLDIIAVVVNLVNDLKTFFRGAFNNRASRPHHNIPVNNSQDLCDMPVLHFLAGKRNHLVKQALSVSHTPFCLCCNKRQP